MIDMKKLLLSTSIMILLVTVMLINDANATSFTVKPNETLAIHDSKFYLHGPNIYNEIMSVLNQNGNQTFSQIQTALNVKKTDLKHHLEYLVKNGTVTQYGASFFFSDFSNKTHS